MELKIKSEIIYELNCFIYDKNESEDNKLWFGLAITPTASKEQALIEGKSIVNSDEWSNRYRGETVYASSYFVNAASNSSDSKCMSFESYHNLGDVPEY